MALHDLTLLQARDMIRDGEIHPREIITHLASRIESRDAATAAFLEADTARALEEADAADVSLPLAGLPVALKDNINALGHPCSCGSKFLHGHYRAPYDSTAAARLKAAGAVLFGRTNMDEFAMGSSTENSAIQTTRNPWDPDCVPGGSSGGSAAAVADGTALAALGSDTGGSIRQPASFCGVVGLKPTYGRVSRYGLVAYASSLDQIGPMTRGVDDAALLLEAIAGPDPHDSTTAPREPETFLPGAVERLDGVRIGIPAEIQRDALSPDVARVFDASIAHLQSLGAEISEVRLPATAHAVAAYYIIAPAEASANLARFDGVRYGRRAESPASLHDLYIRSREEGFGPEVKRRILLGTFVLSSGFYDAYYQTARKTRVLLRNEFAAAFGQVDFILTPTAPEPAFRIGEKSADPVSMYLSDLFTIPANLAGLPSISLPAGFGNGGRPLPIGIQFTARPFAEAALLRAAKAWETTTTAHAQRPPGI